MSDAHRPLLGRSILIVEDEPWISLDVRAAFIAAGATVMSAASSGEALRIAEAATLTGAIVDIDLGQGEDCTKVCERLAERRIPFVFFTGEVRPDILVKWPDAPILTKLADKARIIQVIAGLTAPDAR